MVVIAASNTIRYSLDTEVLRIYPPDTGGWLLQKEIIVNAITGFTPPYIGTWRIYFEFVVDANNDCGGLCVNENAQIYKNGVPYGNFVGSTSNTYLPYTQDFPYINIALSDKIQLYTSNIQQLKGGTRNFRIMFDSSASGGASFTSSPSGARIWIDGIDTTVNTPSTLSSLVIGNHTYKLTLVGYLDATGTFSVTSGSTTTVPTVTLTRISFNALLIAGD